MHGRCADDRVAIGRASRRGQIRSFLAWKRFRMAARRRRPNSYAGSRQSFRNRSRALGWGMTETVGDLHASMAARITKIGRKAAVRRLPVCEMKVVNEKGEEAAAGTQVGELWAKGPNVVKGYWNNPEATRGNLHRWLGQNRRHRAESTRKASATSSTARKTCCSAAARTSTASRSRTCSISIRR